MKSKSGSNEQIPFANFSNFSVQYSDTTCAAKFLQKLNTVSELKRNSFAFWAILIPDVMVFKTLNICMQEKFIIAVRSNNIANKTFDF